MNILFKIAAITTPIQSNSKNRHHFLSALTNETVITELSRESQDGLTYAVKLASCDPCTIFTILERFPNQEMNILMLKDGDGNTVAGLLIKNNPDKFLTLLNKGVGPNLRILTIEEHHKFIAYKLAESHGHNLEKALERYPHVAWCILSFVNSHGTVADVLVDKAPQEFVKFVKFLSDHSLTKEIMRILELKDRHGSTIAHHLAVSYGADLNGILLKHPHLVTGILSLKNETGETVGGLFLHKAPNEFVAFLKDYPGHLSDIFKIESYVKKTPTIFDYIKNHTQLYLKIVLECKTLDLLLMGQSV